MDLAVRDVVSQACWELTTILRTRRFHGVSQLVQVYKSKVLSFVEYRTPAVHHAAKTTLAGIDAVQRRFLHECGLSDEEALLHFNLAPLETRRDIAKLGLIHRSVLGGGPRHFADMEKNGFNFEIRISGAGMEILRRTPWSRIRKQDSVYQ